MKKVLITLAAFAALGLGAAFAQVSGSSCTTVEVNGQSSINCTPVTSDGNGNYSSSSSTSVSSNGGIQNCQLINNVWYGDANCQALNNQQGNYNQSWDQNNQTYNESYDYNYNETFEYSESFDFWE